LLSTKLEEASPKSRVIRLFDLSYKEELALFFVVGADARTDSGTNLVVEILVLVELLDIIYIYIYI
jgi:hypothetical protein